MSRLISYYSQIEPNLRRTASKGLISLLNQQQLEDLAFKYFGIKDEYENIIGYQCPYSNEIYYTYDDIVLEHIVPVASNGGTVLFNCIPTSKKVNGADQKGAKHLITWWTSSSYWDKDAPQRLEKIVNYMLEGYEQVFNEYTVEEVESSYLEIETDESILEEKENINLDKRIESKLLKQAKLNGIHSYLGFILNCIDTLEKCNIDTTQIKDKLKTLEDKHIFEDIERYQLFQNVIQKIIISRTGNDNRSYLTYTLNFDTRKLMDSINLDNEEDIYNEINSRLKNIEELLKINNLSINEYFKSLRNITDIDIIYKNINNISEQEVNVFMENIKIGIDTKINIFIKMLNDGNSAILKQGNEETLEGYPSINLAHFWNRYQEKIKTILFVNEKDNPIFDNARLTVLTYFKVSSYEKLILDLDTKIKIFIKMLNDGNSAILKNGNKETLEGYPSINLAYFWNRHQDKIKTILFVNEKDNPIFDNARLTVLTYFKVSSYEKLILDLDTKIKIFIKMLNDGNSAILKNGNKETLEGYPSINLTQFWNRHQDKIKTILFVNEKDNPRFDNARFTVLTYFKVSSYEELIGKQELDLDTKIKIFIKMLNDGNSAILKQGNEETLEGYPSINLAYFWNNYQEKIKTILFVNEKDNPRFNNARLTVLTYFKVNSYEELIAMYEKLSAKYELDLDTKIKIFIKMLNDGNSAILKNGNKETLEGYPSINLTQFWNRHQDKIKTILFVNEKDNPIFDNARLTVLTYFKVNSYEELEAKKRKSKKLKEDKFIKQQLEKAINAIDEMEVIEQEQRKRA